MARKYGFVNAADVRTQQPGGTNQANMHGSSLRGPRARNNPMTTVSYPKMTHAGAQWAGVGAPLGHAIMSMLGRRNGDESGARGEGGSVDGNDEYSSTAAGTSSTGRSGGRRSALSTSQRLGMDVGKGVGTAVRARVVGDTLSNTGGNAPGKASAAPGIIQPAPASSYYNAPTGMGAKVPVSRSSKFAQGGGL